MQETVISKDQEDVLNAINSMTESFNSKDIDGVMSSYAQGAMVIFEPETPITNFNALREKFLGAFVLNPKFEYPKGHEVFVNGDMATHIAPWTMKGIAPDGSEVQQTGLSIATLRRQNDGKWLLTFDNPHGNYLMNK